MPQVIVNPGAPDERSVEVEGIMNLGRATENQIAILDKSLSRVHARFERNGDVVTVRDMKSTNGTMVNGVRIDACRLYHGDAIRCGDVFLTYVEDPRILKELDYAPTSMTIDEMVISETTRINTSAVRVLESPEGDTSRAKLRILLKVSEVLSSPEAIDTLLDKIVDLLFQIMDVDRVALLIRNEATGQLEPRVVKSPSRPGSGILYEEDDDDLPAHKASPPGSVEAGSTMKLERLTIRPSRPTTSSHIYSRHIVSYVMNKGVAVLSSDAHSDARFGAAASILMQSIRSSMCAPMKAGDKVIGVLYIDNVTIPDRFTGEDLEFLSAFANQAAIAIENSRLYKKIEDEAVLRNSLLRFFPPTTIRRILDRRGQGGEGAEDPEGLGAIETEVTALFSDISGFTQLSATMSPKEIVDMLNEYFPVMADIVFQYEGTLEKYIGDALLAIWGAPFAQPDDAERAVKAAIEMQKALGILNQKWAGRRHLEMHVGLNTGKAAAGRIGSEHYMQYATIGDTTNVASRICNVAAAGEIVVSESTVNKVTNAAIPFVRLAPVVVKGKDEPLQLFRLDWKET